MTRLPQCAHWTAHSRGAVAPYRRAPPRSSWLGADPTRRRVIELLAASPRTARSCGPSRSRTRQSRHLRVPREAGVIAEQRVSDDRRVRLHTLRAQSLEPLSAGSHGSARTGKARLDSFTHCVALRGQGGANLGVVEEPLRGEAPVAAALGGEIVERSGWASLRRMVMRVPAIGRRP
jgi:hypothetical protein